MSDETGDPGAPGAGAEDSGAAAAPADAGPPATETTEPVAAAAPPPSGPAVTTTTVETTDAPGRHRWLTAVLAGIAALALLGLGFGIGRWTEGGGDGHDFRFSNGREYPGPRGGPGFAGPGFGPNGNGNGPRFGPGFGPRFNGPNGGSNEPNDGSDNGPSFGPRGRGFAPNQNGNGSGPGSTTTTQPALQ
jgi:hypothetical protein